MIDGNEANLPNPPESDIPPATDLSEQLRAQPTLYKHKPPKSSFLDIPGAEDVPVQMDYADNLPGAYPLPENLWWVGYYASNELDVLENHPAYYHGTRQSRIEGIKTDAGLKMHPEPNTPEKFFSVYATPDPILAAHHAYRNGPEDARNPERDKTDPNDPAVLLKPNIEEYAPDQVERLQQRARHTYEVMRSGRQSNYIGEPMGSFVPIEMISVVVPEGEDGMTREVPLSEWEIIDPAH